MTCRAQDIALNVASKENVTVKEVVKELESVYVDEDNVLMKCDSFDRMIRKPDQSMKEFVYVYDCKVEELKKADVVIPDIVFPSKILRAAYLPHNHYFIARQSCTTMTFDNA